MKRYEVYEMSTSGMLVSHSAGMNFSERMQGAKPIAVIFQNKLLLREGSRVLSISDESRTVSNKLELNFKPLKLFQLSQNEIMLFGK